MTSNDTRNEALKSLREVLDSGRFIQDAVRDAGLVEKGASDLDLRFILNLVRGTVERKTILEAVLSKLLKTQGKMKPLMRYILLQGLYELFFTNGKSYAVVNEYVQLAKRRGFSGLSGFVNAILRRADREKESLLARLTEKEACGLPEEVLSVVSAAVGEENALIFARYVLSDASKKLTVRRNISLCSEETFKETLREDDAQITPQKLPDLETDTAGLPEDEIFILDTGRMISELKAFKEGLFYVQDISSWTSFRTLGAYLKPENKVLDLCAAPGGKTFQLMDLARKKGIQTRFTACDVSEKRLMRLRENAKRMGFTELETRIMDAIEYKGEYDKAFDLVIADVPCSGLGDLSGKPEIRFHYTEDSILQLAAVQNRILQNAAAYVRPGGILQYSTCTMACLENQNRIWLFLRNHPEFSLISEKTLVPGVNTPGDGFYFARMKRSEQ